MQKLYKILGVSENATIEEIDIAYKTLKEKYSEERFLEGELGNEAAKKLTQLENAYIEIKAEKGKGENKDYSAIEKEIKQGKIALAQEKLDQITERDAHWHYLQSVIFYKKNWVNESKKQLEIAMSIEPKNTKYADAYTKLNEKIAFNEKQFNSGNASSNAEEQQVPPQMGGSALDGCCSWCTTMCCMNMLLDLCCHC